jgi:SSS family solute:Na+ symporter
VLVILYLSAGPILFGDQIPGGKIHSYLVIVFGTLMIFLSGFIISWLMPGSKANKKIS